MRDPWEIGERSLSHGGGTIMKTLQSSALVSPVLMLASTTPERSGL